MRTYARFACICTHCANPHGGRLFLAGAVESVRALWKCPDTFLLVTHYTREGHGRAPRRSRRVRQSLTVMRRTWSRPKSSAAESTLRFHLMPPVAPARQSHRLVGLSNRSAFDRVESSATMLVGTVSAIGTPDVLRHVSAAVGLYGHPHHGQSGEQCLRQRLHCLYDLCPRDQTRPSPTTLCVCMGLASEAPRKR